LENFNPKRETKISQIYTRKKNPNFSQFLCQKVAITPKNNTLVVPDSTRENKKLCWYFT
jgi:hypothetical protein